MSDGSVPEMIGGRYETVRLIGRGGMGSVWLAEDTLLGRHVAVKQVDVLPGEAEEGTQRALREARSAAALNHPNVVALYDAIEHDGAPWLVMEFVAGQTLSAWVAEHGPLEPEAAAEVGARLASGLAAAHRAGISHRDIKPANVFMAGDGEPKIGDFGTARAASDDHLTLAGVVTGTPSYMAPEVADGGEHGPAADVWALGATLYLAVEGEDAYPGVGNALATLRTIATSAPRAPQRAGVLEPVLARMLTHDPERRGTMEDAVRELEAIAPGRPGAILGAVAGAGAASTPGAPGVGTADEPTQPRLLPLDAEGAPESADPAEPTDPSGLFGFPGLPDRRAGRPARDRRGRRPVLVVAGIAAAAVLAVGAAALTLGGDDDRRVPRSAWEATPPTSTSSTSRESTSTSTTRESTSTTQTPSETSEQAPTQEPAPEPTTEAPAPQPTSVPPSPEPTSEPTRTTEPSETSTESTQPSETTTESETTEPTETTEAPPEEPPEPTTEEPPPPMEREPTTDPSSEPTSGEPEPQEPSSPDAGATD